MTRVDEILAGRRGLSADTALRLGRLFGTTAEFWLSLQAACDLEAAKYAPGTWEEVQQIEPLDLSQCLVES